MVQCVRRRYGPDGQGGVARRGERLHPCGNTGETMIRLDPKRTAAVAIDMHRGHLDPEMATLPLAAERCGPVIDRAAQLFQSLRQRGVPIVHAVTEYRHAAEIMANPYSAPVADAHDKAP